MDKAKIVPTPEDVERKRNAIRSFKAQANAKRTRTDKIADFLTDSFGTVPFLALNAVLFIAWITWNTGNIPGLAPIDPFPFGLLTMVVSLEAIFLAIIVLISQNREARIADLREEMELYVGRYAETEITKIIYLLTLLLKKDGIDLSKDEDVQQMLKKLECDKVEEELEKQLGAF